MSCRRSSNGWQRTATAWSAASASTNTSGAWPRCGGQRGSSSRWPNESIDPGLLKPPNVARRSGRARAQRCRFRVAERPSLDRSGKRFGTGPVDRAGDRLTYPPGGRSREGCVRSPVVVIDRVQQPAVAFLNEIEKPKPWSVVASRNRDNEAQVGFHERSPCALVARLCGPCEPYLIVGFQKGETADLGQVH